jgi:hypothetical protein
MSEKNYKYYKAWSFAPGVYERLWSRFAVETIGLGDMDWEELAALAGVDPDDDEAASVQVTEVEDGFNDEFGDDEEDHLQVGDILVGTVGGETSVIREIDNSLESGQTVAEVRTQIAPYLGDIPQVLDAIEALTGHRPTLKQPVLWVRCLNDMGEPGEPFVVVLDMDDIAYYLDDERREVIYGDFDGDEGDDQRYLEQYCEAYGDEEIQHMMISMIGAYEVEEAVEYLRSLMS